MSKSNETPGAPRIGAMMDYAIGLAPMTVLLSVDQATRPDQLQSGLYERLHLAMNAAQARALGAALLRNADRVDAQPAMAATH